MLLFITTKPDSQESTNQINAVSGRLADGRRTVIDVCLAVSIGKSRWAGAGEHACLRLHTRAPVLTGLTAALGYVGLTVHTRVT